MANVLVTGATGLLGNVLVRTLLDRGEAVRVLVRASSSPEPLDGIDVTKVVGDVTDEASVRKAVEGCDRVVHSAGLIHIGWKRLDEARRINIDGTRHVASAARDAGCRLVHVSTVDTLPVAVNEVAVDEETAGPPKLPCTYVVTKTQAEREIVTAVEAGLDGVIVNPGFMLGPYDWKPSSGRMLVDVVKHPFAPAPTGGCSVCDVRDVAAGTLAALEQGETGKRYILAGENVPYHTLWERFSHAVDRIGPPRCMNAVERAVAGVACDLWGAVTRREPIVNSAILKMSTCHHYYSSKRAADTLGYTNRSLDDTIRDALAWFRSRGLIKR